MGRNNYLWADERPVFGPPRPPTGPAALPATRQPASATIASQTPATTTKAVLQPLPSERVGQPTQKSKPVLDEPTGPTKEPEHHEKVANEADENHSGQELLESPPLKRRRSSADQATPTSAKSVRFEMSDRPAAKRNPSSGSQQVGGRSPGNAMKTVYGGGKGKIGVRVPSYKNMSKLGGRAGTTRAVMPRNTSKTALRKNQSETMLLHGRGGAAEPTSPFEAPAVSDERHSLPHTSENTAHDLRKEHVHTSDKQTTKTPEKSQTSDVKKGKQPVYYNESDADEDEDEEDNDDDDDYDDEDDNDDNDEDETMPSVRSQPKATLDGPYKSHVPHVVVAAMEAPGISKPQETSKTQENRFQDNMTAAPEGKQQTKTVTDSAKTSSHSSDTSDTTNMPVTSQMPKHQSANISNGKQPEKQPILGAESTPTAQKGRTITFAMGDPTTATNKIGPIQAQPKPPAMTAYSDEALLEMAGSKLPNIEQEALKPDDQSSSSSDEESGMIAKMSTVNLKGQQNLEAPTSSKPVPSIRPSASFNVQTNLERDRMMQMQTVHAFPPSAWKSTNLLQAAAHANDPSSDYNKKLLKRMTRETENKVSKATGSGRRNPLIESLMRLQAGGKLGSSRRMDLSGLRTEEAARAGEAGIGDWLPWKKAEGMDGEKAKGEGEEVNEEGLTLEEELEEDLAGDLAELAGEFPDEWEDVVGIISGEGDGEEDEDEEGEE